MILSWTIWCAGIVLEAALLLRSFAGRLFSRYPFFYVYIASVLVTTLVLLSPVLYDKFYWAMQFATLIIGYGILLELLRHALAPYPGAEKFAMVSGVVAFAAILCFSLIAPLILPQWSKGTTIELERDLRTVQAIFIFLLLWVISYYGIVIGRNIKGMILGYGLYIGTSLLSLAVRAYAGLRFDEVWKVVQPLSYAVSLVVWLVALWSYCPNPVPQTTLRLEEDYQAFAARTRSMVGNMRSYLGRATRQ